MKPLIRELLKLNWCGMMVENSKHQNTDLKDRIRHCSLPREIVDRSQIWDATPQGHEYWSRIQCYDC